MGIQFRVQCKLGQTDRGHLVEELCQHVGLLARRFHFAGAPGRKHGPLSQRAVQAAHLSGQPAVIQLLFLIGSLEGHRFSADGVLNTTF